MKSKKALLLIGIIILGGSVFVWQKNKQKHKQQVFNVKKQIEIIEDGISVVGIKTEAKTVGELIGNGGLNLDKEDRIYPGKETKIKGGMKLLVFRAIPIKVSVDGKIINKKVFAENVKEGLEEFNIKLNPADIVSPELGSKIFRDIEIVITRINHKEVVEEENIDYKVIQKKDNKLKWRIEKIKQKGKKGKKKVKYLVTYKDGKEIKRKKISSELIEKPVDEIIVVGTKIKIGKTQKGRASWYAYTGKMAAASITYPKGTWLRVTAINSGKQIFVVINDYGPMASTGKILDLDKVAFQKLAPLGAGVIDVKIEEIK